MQIDSGNKNRPMNMIIKYMIRVYIQYNLTFQSDWRLDKTKFDILTSL